MQKGAAPPTLSDDLRDLARTIGQTALGFDVLRPGQEEALGAVLSGHDTLVVMPTGSGKSAVYQIAGALIDGPTVVVSPLLALQRDQVGAMAGRLGGATEFNSTMGPSQRAEALRKLAAGETEFVFLAPEQLGNDTTRAWIAELRPSLLVVDEAHCISSWGHDFRPDYLRLGAMVEALGHPQVLALTATAAPPVRREIVEQLGMKDPEVVVTGFQRPNITLGVETFETEAEAREALVERAVNSPGTGILYTASRRQAECLTVELAAAGRDAGAYHAGMSSVRRNVVHARFLDADPFVVVATIAFGMGIDAPHVRFVLHADPPESIDAYYQEFGRAGRDGAPADAVVFAHRQHAGGRRFSGGTGEVPPAVLERTVRALRVAGGPVPARALAEWLGITPTRLITVLALLAETGAVTVTASGESTWVGGKRHSKTVVEAARAAGEARRTVDRTRTEMMRRYLQSPSCRWSMVLGYFGQVTDERCGHCDNCAAGAASGHHVEGTEDRPFSLGSRVRHTTWGAGEVLGYENGIMTVLFETSGYRRLSVDLVRDGELLGPA